MQEQTQRQRRARRDDEFDTEAKAVDVTAVAEAAECCLTEIDEALEAAACCLAEAEAVLKPKTWREMTDQELLDAGELQGDAFIEVWQRENEVDVAYGDMTHAQQVALYGDLVARRNRYDVAYQRITGVANRRDCGCGCR